MGTIWEKDWIKDLPDGFTIFFRMETFHDELHSFTVALLKDGESVTRYDTAHGFPHRDVRGKKAADTLKNERSDHLTLKEAFRHADEDLSANYAAHFADLRATEQIGSDEYMIRRGYRVPSPEESEKYGKFVSRKGFFSITTGRVLRQIRRFASGMKPALVVKGPAEPVVSVASWSAGATTSGSAHQSEGQSYTLQSAATSEELFLQPGGR